MVKSLLKKKLIAEVTLAENSAQKLSQTNGEVQQQTSMKIQGVTSDLRVAELVQEVSKAQQNKSDIVISHVSTGNIEYIRKIKESTEVTDTKKPGNSQGVGIEQANTETE